MSSKCSSKVGCHCLADVVWYIPNLGGFLYFGSVLGQDGFADSKLPLRIIPKDEEAEGGSSKPFQGKPQCWWLWFQWGQEEKQNIRTEHRYYKVN